MKRSTRLLAWFLVYGPAASSNLEGQFEKTYEAVDLANGVLAIVWQDMMSYPFEGNHLVVIGDDAVLVVDANRTPSLTDSVIAFIRRTTDKPVRYVVNTHWHADHLQGNSVYRVRYPDVEILGHPNTVAGMDSVLVPYVTEVQDDLARVRQSLDSTGLSDEDRGPLQRQLASLERESLLYDHVNFLPPTTLVHDSVVIDLGSRKVIVWHPGWANTDGDLVVYVPDAEILAVGDIVTEPFPLMGWDAPQSWHRVLNQLLALEPDAILPGHGEVMRSMEKAELFRDFLGDLSAQVAKGIASGRSLEDLQTGVDLIRYWEAFGDNNERRVEAFRLRFQPNAVQRAYLELASGR